ncbi:hypothetical protein [Nocardioides convexus]|uniref:hypothetical protein n=1 Tax=Nocardioides convexus TaxID=2712224 RepID=UPI0024184CBC|nr:hypothetical protein [Nocardioides convexus]
MSPPPPPAGDPAPGSRIGRFRLLDQARPGRHGRGLPRPGGEPRPRGRAQGDRAAVGARPGLPGPLHP